MPRSRRGTTATRASTARRKRSRSNTWTSTPRRCRRRRAADEAALRQRYEQEKARFVEPEQRLASHILVKVDAECGCQRRRRPPKQKAATLAAQARQPGADFAALAAANSDDAGSKAAAATSAGSRTTAAMVEAVRGCAVRDEGRADQWSGQDRFRLARDPVARDQGRQAEPFEDVRDELDTRAGRGRSRARVQRTDRQAGRPGVEESRPRSRRRRRQRQPAGADTRAVRARRTAPGIAANQAVLRAAFSDALIQDGTVSDPIEIGPGHSVVIRVTQHTPERAQPLAQVQRARGRRDPRRSHAPRPPQADADAMVAKLREGETLAGAGLGDRAGCAATCPNVPRGAPVPTPAATRSLFRRCRRLRPARCRRARRRWPTAACVVFAVTKVTPGDPTEANAGGAHDAAAAARAAGAATTDADGLLKALRKRMKITRGRRPPVSRRFAIARKSPASPGFFRSGRCCSPRSRHQSSPIPVMPRML